MVQVRNRITSKIASILGNQPLACAIHSSIQSGLGASFCHIVAGGKHTWTVFDVALKAAIRDIENHPLGKLFQRLIEYGPHNPDDPEDPASEGKTTLSDPECATCVEFIYSHMINRFKGELAELLAMKPVIKLVQQLQNAGQLPVEVNLQFGNTILEQRRVKKSMSGDGWAGFVKGADGLITRESGKALTIYGVVEVKSMHRSMRQLEDQLYHHVSRLAGGVKLDGRIWNADAVRIGSSEGRKKRNSTPLFVMVVPSSWKVDRKWWW